MRDIIGFEGLYQISEEGHVWSMRQNKWMHERENNCGYLVVGLIKDGKLYQPSIHRLVAEAYLDNQYNLTDVDHIDCDKHNNNVANLKWMSHKENVRKAICKKVICVETGNIFDSLIDASKWANIKSNALHNCLRGYNKTSGGYHWEYYIT